MKGAVVVLALLVTAELHVQPAEACIIFYDVFTRVLLGEKKPLFDVLDVVNATEPEKSALGKIQDCFKDGGFKAKAADTLALLKITFSKECLLENPQDVVKDFAKFPEYLTALVQTV